MFEKLEWSDDRVVLNGVTFLLEGRAKPGSKGGLWLHKSKPIMDEYDRLFADYPALHVQNMLELGIWKGGSVALWMELLQPAKSVALDLIEGEDSAAFRRYVQERGLGERLKTYWRTDQADSSRLMEIVEAEFEGPLNFVIDDASHAYAPTKASFETLFPLLREEGLYVIEDWSWQFAPEFRADFPDSEPGLLPLLSDLAVLLVGAPGLVRRMEVRRPFIVLQRGGLSEEDGRRAASTLWHGDMRALPPDRWLPLRRAKRRLMTAIRRRG